MERPPLTNQGHGLIIEKSSEGIMKTANILILASVLCGIAPRAWAQSEYPDAIIQEARRLNYPLTSLKGASMSYTVLKNGDGSSDYSVALKELRRDAEAYHNKLRSAFLAMTPEEQDSHLKKMQGLSEMRGVTPAEHEEYAAQVHDLSTVKVLADAANQSPEQTKFQLDKLQALSEMRGIPDDEQAMYRQQYKALSVMSYLKEVPPDQQHASELKGAGNDASSALKTSDKNQQDIDGLKGAALASWQQSGGFDQPADAKVQSLMTLLDAPR